MSSPFVSIVSFQDPHSSPPERVPVYHSPIGQSPHANSNGLLFPWCSGHQSTPSNARTAVVCDRFPVELPVPPTCVPRWAWENAASFTVSLAITAYAGRSSVMKKKVEIWEWTCDGCGRNIRPDIPDREMPSGWTTATITITKPPGVPCTEGLDFCLECSKDPAAAAERCRKRWKTR